MRNTLILFTAAMFVAGCGNTDTQVTQNTAAANTMSSPANAAKPAASATPTPEAPSSNLKPDSVSPDKAIPAAELSKAFFADQAAWKGKTVTITGNYDSHTTSTVASGKIIRIDIADASRKKVAACQVTAEPTKEEVAQRENRTFKGTVKETWFSQVLLEPCEMLK